MKVGRRPAVLEAWPPKNPAGKRIYQRTIAQYADILWTIREHGGEVEEESGLLATKLLGLLANPAVMDSGKTSSEKHNNRRFALTVRLNELADMDLVDVYRNGKRTFRVVEKFDGPYPFTNPHQSQRRADETARKVEAKAEQDAADAEAARIEGERAREQAEGLAAPPRPTAADVSTGVSAVVAALEGSNGVEQERVGPLVTVDNQMVIDYGALAAVLLDEVVRRATTIPDDLADTPSYVYVERNQLAEMNARLTERARTLERQSDDRSGRIKSLELELAEGRRMLDRMEKNLIAAAAAVEQMERRIGDNISADTRRELERIMQGVPGFVREYKSARRTDASPMSRDLPEGVTVGAARGR